MPETIPTLDDQAKQNDLAYLLATARGVKPNFPAAAAPAAAPAGIPPVAAAPAPAAPDLSAVTGAPGGIPSLAPPSKAEASAAGKREFQAGMPSVTAAPLTPDYYSQQRAVTDYKTAHPWGSDISAHPGTLGKIGHVLGEAGNIAGNALIPKVMAGIPGTEANTAIKRGQESEGFTNATENELRQQQIESSAASEAAAKAGNEPTPWTPLGSNTPMMVPFKSIPTLEAANTKAQSAEQAAETKNEPALAKLGYRMDDQGKMVPIPDEQLSPEAKQQRSLTAALTSLHEAQTEVAKAKNDPNSPAFKLAQERLNQAQATAQRQIEAMGLHQAEFQNKVQEQGLVKPSGQASSRGSAAAAALELIPNLEASIKANAKEFGPIIGRIHRGEIALGSVPPNVQKMYAQIESFYSLQPAIHGFRKAEFVKDFDTFVGNLQTNPDSLIAGLEGLRPTLTAVQNEGKTFHKRIVEGAGGGAGGAGGGGEQQKGTVSADILGAYAKKHGISEDDARKFLTGQGFKVP